ncbi:MAG TPA: D-alanyl-D-alanine carboxypeptidase/D-alanyl-D-alanine-endopeptidase, partial [Pyrinomonadaceae bacterium]|nr:D-alanyl-D-alanine carboxypeptidase/D-alanyl-D-alanine-endopeptidase [Pyrinomonadaceae bacterium]
MKAAKISKIYCLHFCAVLLNVFILCASYAISVNGQGTQPAGSTKITPPAAADISVEIRSILSRPELRRGIAALKIIDLASGKTLFEENADKYVMPASNMKSFTVAAVLDKFGADYRTYTSLYGILAPIDVTTSPVNPTPQTSDTSLPQQDKMVAGDLYIFGRGDVSYSTRFGYKDLNSALDRIVDALIAKGVKKITGDIVGDDSFFKGSTIPEGWEWDDLQWSYGAEVTALPINDNVVTIYLKPGTVGLPCLVRMEPQNPVVRIISRCTTSDKSVPRRIAINKPLEQNSVEITGTLPSGTNEAAYTIAVSRPQELFAALLRQRLIEKGVTVVGGYRSVHRQDFSLPPGLEIARIESPPLAEIIANTMKPSQNMYTEVLLRLLGEALRQEQKSLAGANPRPDNQNPLDNSTSDELGRKAVRNFLDKIGVAPDGIVQYDGSGLSRHNLVSASAIV